ncbi:MAG TPA: hypothetical protein VJB05_01755 [archaeon]|nr:hypothetical protein [archaeon]
MEFKTDSGLVSIDTADMLPLLRNANRISFVIEDSYSTTKIGRRIKGADVLVVMIHGPRSATIKDCQKIVGSLCSKVKKRAWMVWGHSFGKKELLVIAAWKKANRKDKK